MENNKPVLYIFSGLPGTGKTTLSQLLAKNLKAVHLRIDTVEQAIRDLCSFKVEGEGYRLSYRVASDNLRLGLSVISDSCNPIVLTRDEWEQVAVDSESEFINIEVICSDKSEHRKRVETRKSSVKGLTLPTWEKVVNREYDIWTSKRVVIDTAFKTEYESFDELLSEIKLYFN
ncbi:MAG: AAA family ATPase [Deltaproteobacteria bacterium]|nr:AAA family ATPase [Deltaproteobacteria bacterium]